MRSTKLAGRDEIAMNPPRPASVEVDLWRAVLIVVLIAGPYPSKNRLARMTRLLWEPETE